MIDQSFNLQASSFFDLSQWELADYFDIHAPAWFMLKAMNRLFAEKKEWEIRCPVPDGVILVNDEQIDIAHNCILEPGAYIQGPCILGPHTQVRHGAYIRGQVLAASRCVIGHTTEVKNSLLLDGAKAGHFAYIGDSILGHNVNLGAGVKCANLRLDHGPIKIRYMDQVHRTDLKKLGSILGDHCQIGCNSVLNPGCMLGPKSTVWPLVNVGGIYPPSSQIKPLANSL